MQKAKRLISLFLVFAMLAAYVPAVYAEENTEEASELTAEVVEEVQEAEQPAEEAPEAEEAEEAAEEASEEPEEAEVPEEKSEEVPAEEAEEAAEETEEETEEESEEDEQPALSAEELEKKALLAENGVVETLAKMTEGVDYTAGVVLRITDSREDAIAAAEAYHGELLSYVADVAEIGLTDLTVLEAVTLAADPDSGLPAVSPNYLAKAASRNLSDTTEAGLNSMANLAPRRLDWYTVVQEIFDNPDPLISDPGADYYQWQHDVLHTYTAWGVTPGVADTNLMKIAIISDGVQNLDGELLDLNTAHGNELLGLGESFENHLDGTAAAHVMAANFNNGTMGAGVLPGVKLISYNVVREDGVFNTADIAKAIRDAISVDAKVIYIDRIFEWYVASYDDALRNAVGKGVTVVAPLGDYGTNVKTYPAASTGVVGVAGTTRAGTRAGISNYGKYADLSAPGEEIPVSINGAVRYWSGSCPAAAMVAGAAAMYMIAKRCYMTPSEVREGLKKGTNKAAESGLGAGILDLEKMLDSGTAAPKIKVVDVNNRTIAASALSEDGSEESGDASVMEDSGFVGGIGHDGENAPAMPTDPNVGNGEAAVKITAKKVSSEDFLVIEKPDINYNDMVIITFDGSTPAVLNGEIVNGYRFSGKVRLSIFGPGKVVIKAMVISAAGKLSKVAAIKLDIIPESAPKEVDILAPKEMIAGGTVTLTAEIVPDTAKQEVGWSLVDRGTCTSAYIDIKTGKLTTSPYQTGTIKVRAAAAADPEKVYKEVEITVKSGVQVGSVVLNETSLNMLVYGDNDKYNSFIQFEPTFLDANGGRIEGDVDCKFTSSNPKIVSVSENGFAVALAKGTATITCTALDGSNKKATCKMTVRDGADTVKLVGQASIAPGASATYKLETNPKVKLPVRWYLADAERNEDGAPGGISISSSGKVTVDSRVLLGTEFRVCYESNDSQYIYSGSYLVTVSNKTTAVKIQYDSDLTSPNEFVNNKNGSLKSVTIFSTPALEGKNSDGIYVNSNVILLYSEFVGLNISRSPYRETWTSSNPSVATVDPLSGLVVGLKAGTTKITCKANDGSNKSASVTVKVVTPASSVTVVGPTGIDTVNYGKSVSNKAVLGDAYGKPSVKSVNWKVALVTEEVYNNAGEYLGYYDRTQEAVSRGYVTVSSSGKLTVKKTAENLQRYANSYLEVTVLAKAKDGGEAYGLKTYQIRPAAKSIYTYTKNLEMYTNSNINSSPIVVYVDGLTGCTTDMQIKSSNPEVAGGEVICANGRGYVFVYSGDKKGTAKLTITTADQAKKSTTITVKVK